MIYRVLTEYAEAKVSDVGLSHEVLNNQESYRRMLSQSIRTCCSGNYGAKETVKELIRSYLVKELHMTGDSMSRMIPFDNSSELTAMQMMEIMIYVRDKEKEDKGFQKLWQESGWGNTEETNPVITEEMVRSFYLSQQTELDFADRIMIVSQLLFADTVGLGAVDTLNQQKGCVEEIQLGMNGYSEANYDYKTALLAQQEGIFYNRDGVHVLIQGKTVWLQYLSFRTEDELRRVLRNLVRDSQAGELTRNHPMIVVDTMDGRRVSVSRPPLTDSWVGLIRKFDTVTNVSLEGLYRNTWEGCRLPELLRCLIRSGRNIAITGEMATGKTTLFRACLRETGKERNIRVIEADSFELNVRSFLPERNSMTMRVTAVTPAQEVLAFARKTTGQIFAVGEVNSASVAVMMMDLAKIATQLFFSAHYVTTEHMITDFVNAKLCVGGYTEEGLARLDVIRCLGFDIHLRNRHGHRYIKYIHEIIPREQFFDSSGELYQIREIYRYDEETGKGEIVRRPSRFTYERAKEELSEEEYREFQRFFADVPEEEQ